MVDDCQLCKRILNLTEHHLIPKEMHNKKWCKSIFTVEECNNNKIYVCHDCHAAIHMFISNKDLAKKYNNLDKLKEHEKLMNFVKWVSKNEQRKFKY